MPPPQPFEWKNLNALSDLELDPENPRLSRRYRGKDQAGLIEAMIAQFDVLSLAEAIASAGFLEFDPIAGYSVEGGMVRIREGNRRVAAAKLLLEPTLAPLRYQRACGALSDSVTPETRRDLESLRVQVWDNPDSIELTAYIGYRHVTGVRPWPPVEKARYIADLIESESLSYKQVADRIGSKPRHVERHYLAYQMVEQGISEEVPGAENMEDSFGVLLRALQAKGIPEFLGINYTGVSKAAISPVPNQHHHDFTDFVRWTFGTDESPKVVGDSRLITRWATILGSEPAVAYLRRTAQPDFNRAWERSGGESATVTEMLLVAADNLREAVPIVADHASEPEVLAAATECARFFNRLAKEIPAILDPAGSGQPNA
jgi:hypothetical protein